MRGEKCKRKKKEKQTEVAKGCSRSKIKVGWEWGEEGREMRARPHNVCWYPIFHRKDEREKEGIRKEWAEETNELEIWETSVGGQKQKPKTE